MLGGARIEAAGNIEVCGIIENAEIQTSGNLVVRGGIRQSEGHKVVVKGYINAKYIDGGDIQADKDIMVERDYQYNSAYAWCGSDPQRTNCGWRNSGPQRYLCWSGRL